MTRNPQDQITADALAHMVARVTSDVLKAEPVVTTCPCCGRPNPCPLHLFVEQCDFNRSRGL